MSLRRTAQICTALFLLFLAPAAFGQERDNPMPVTVITDAMIRDLGALNLRDLLVTYVPGMTWSQDHNEPNIAMRGAFASSQQKVLILIDGHQLNTRALDAADPDFGISLDRVKRIEVLRGPASVTYGSGALAAVVNIFTKTAADLDGAMVLGGGGNWGRAKFSGLYGAKTTKGDDIFAWGTVFRSAGEVVQIPASQDYSRHPKDSQAILDGFSGPASHDAGVNIRTKGFTLLAAHRLGKYIEPFSAGGATGESYVYDDYQTDAGFGPGQAIRALNLDLSHDGTVAGGTHLLLRGYFDRNDLIAHLVTDPSVKAHSSVKFSDWDTGFIAELSGNYDATKGGRRGHWLAGGQADVMHVFDGVLMSGSGGGWTTVGATNGLVEAGDEKIYSAYAEIKQPITDKVIADAGLRFDHKIRHEGPAIDRASPRVALIFLPSDRTGLAVSYSESFIDAPYWYRYNSLPSYRGSRNLQPEFLRSFQVTPSFTLAHGVTLRSNVFVNTLRDLIGRNKTAGPGDPNYQNAGHLTNWGVEPELAYTRVGFNASGNVTFQRAASFEKFDATGGDVHNVPMWTANAIVNVKIASLGRDTWLNVTGRYIGSQLSPVNIVIGDTVFNEPNRVVDATFLTNAGIRIGGLGGGKWFADARVFNLFNADYEQGGSVSHPYPQPGRSAMFTVGVGF